MIVVKALFQLNTQNPQKLVQGSGVKSVSVLLEAGSHVSWFRVWSLGFQSCLIISLQLKFMVEP